MDWEPGFKAYEKSNYVFNNIKDKKFKGIKVMKESDLPLRLAKGQVIYGLVLVQRTGGNYIQIRSSSNIHVSPRKSRSELKVREDYVPNGDDHLGCYVGTNIRGLRRCE